MHAAILLRRLQSRGFSFHIDGGRLFVNPRASLTETDQQEIKANKEQIIELLNTNGLFDGAPFFEEDGTLRIPFNCLPKYWYWAGGQSIWSTLAELNAPLAAWEKCAYRNEDLITGEHSQRCRGAVRDGIGVRFCVECGYYCEVSREL